MTGPAERAQERSAHLVDRCLVMVHEAQVAGYAPTGWRMSGDVWTGITGVAGNPTAGVFVLSLPVVVDDRLPANSIMLTRDET